MFLRSLHYWNLEAIRWNYWG